MKTVHALKGILVALMAISMPLSGLGQNKEMKISPLRYAGIHALSNQQGESDAYIVIQTAPGNAWNFTLLNFDNAQKVSLQHAKPAFFSYLKIIDLCTNQSGFGFTLAELNTRSFDDSEIFWRGIMPGKTGSMLTYEFMPLNGKLQLNVVRFQDTIQ